METIQQIQTIVIPKPKTNLEARARRLTNCFLSKGFLYLKIELEANVDPDDYSRGYDCDSCSGSGTETCGTCEGSETIEVRCSTCNGRGILTTSENAQSQPSQPCPDCSDGIRESACENCSEGHVNCSNCDGNGHFQDEHSYDDYHDDFSSAFKEKLGEVKDCLKYFQIYHDGSVDTEITLTLRVNYLKELPGIVSAFAQTCREFGNCGTSNAGLHITLLPGYKYPRTQKLDERKLANFKKQVNKLLLGLVCLGTPDESTRAFEFRDLEISSDMKYSAIYTHGDTCLEFRLFDTCFDAPYTIIRYLELISKTLHYYTDKTKWILKLKEHIPLKKTNEILNKKYQGCYRKLVEVFETDESIKRLFTELTYLVKEKSKKWLTDAYNAYSQGLISKQQLFSELAMQIKCG